MMSIHDYHRATTTLTRLSLIIKVSIEVHSTAPVVESSGTTDSEYNAASESINEIYHAVDNVVNEHTNRHKDIDLFEKSLLTSDEVASQWYLDYFQ